MATRNPPEKPTESVVIEQMVGAAAAGDRQAQQDLLRRYWSLIRDIIHTRRQRVGHQLRDREQTQDQQQDIAVHLLRDLPKHVWHGKKAFLAWMRKLADAKVIDAQRHHRALKRDAGAETGVEQLEISPQPSRPSPETMIDQNRRLAATESLLEQLKPEYAAAVRLHCMGYSHSEIGEALDCTPEAARKLVARGFSKMQGLRET